MSLDLTNQLKEEFRERFPSLRILRGVGLWVADGCLVLDLDAGKPFLLSNSLRRDQTIVMPLIRQWPREQLMDELVWQIILRVCR